MSAQSELILDWINKADHDLGSAKIIYLHLPDYFDTIAFHCQQAVEKYIKAILVHREIEFDRSHDLIYLLELLPEDIQVTTEQFKKAASLNGFSVQIRYPNKIILLTKEELEEAIAISLEFRAFATVQVGINENITGS
ncbi:MAG: HEPN domain-containing protein [Bacteroidales bacterium]